MFKYLNIKRKKGFTLIETAIYVGLFAVIVGSVLVVFYQILGSQNQERNRIEVDAEANFMMQKILWALTGASAINQPVQNATSSVLSINKYNFPGNPIVFDVVSGALRISRANGLPVVLNSNRVAVNTLTFTHWPSLNSAPESVRVILSVVASDTSGAAVASTTLRNIVYLNL